MPKMSGLKLIAEVKKVRPKIPIILCTGDCPELSERYGVDEVVHKPFREDHLYQTVQRLIGLY